MPIELHTDCTHCLVQGAVLESWDEESACGRLGIPVTTRCRLCARTCEGRLAGADGGGVAGSGTECCPTCGSEIGDDVREAHRCPYCGAHGELRETCGPRSFATKGELEAALAEWAREEGFESAQDLLESSFLLPQIDIVLAAIARGEKVETTFDVVDFLFRSGGGTGGGSERASLREAAPDTIRNPSVPSLRPSSLRGRTLGGPREELLALAAVAAADGAVNAEDRAALFRAAQRRGIAPLEEGDLRVWRPNEIEPPTSLVTREEVLQEMFQLAWADGEMDASEVRVIRDFGRAWGIDPLRIAAWTEEYTFADANGFERWLRRIGLFLFPGR